MKIFLCIALFCLFLIPVSTVYADDPLPSASRFPLKNLEELRIALDAALGALKERGGGFTRINNRYEHSIFLIKRLGIEDL